MRIPRRACVFVCAFAIALEARGETFTFTQEVDQEWNTQGNWSPFGRPVAGDTAIIPNGKHCKVEAMNQLAQMVQVNSGGTLGLVGKQLTIGSPSSPATSTINGLLYLDADGAGTPGRLACNGSFLLPFGAVLAGTGTISARRDDGYGPGELVRANSTLQNGFAIGSDLTLVGSIAVKCDLLLDGVMKVDDADDTLTLGVLTGGSPVLPRFGGTGQFRVSAGLMSVNKVLLGMAIDPTLPPPAWILTGGESDVADVSDNDLFLNRSQAITITGGLLDIHQNFSTDGVFSVNGGQVRVAVQAQTFAASRAA